VRPRKRQSAPIGDPLTAEKVRELLWEAKVLPRRKQLTAAAESRLTQRLNAVHYSFAVDGVLDPANAAKRDVIASIGAAQRALAKLAGHERGFLAAAEKAFATKLSDYHKASCGAKRDDLEQIASADGLLKYVAAMPVLAPRYSTGQAQKWASHGLILFDALREALASIGKPLGLSSSGPAGRFVAAITPLLTGEQTTAGSAAKQLQGVRRKAQVTTGAMTEEILDLTEADNNPAAAA